MRPLRSYAKVGWGPHHPAPQPPRPWATPSGRCRAPFWCGAVPSHRGPPSMLLHLLWLPIISTSAMTLRAICTIPSRGLPTRKRVFIEGGDEIVHPSLSQVVCPLPHVVPMPAGHVVGPPSRGSARTQRHARHAEGAPHPWRALRPPPVRPAQGYDSAPRSGGRRITRWSCLWGRLLSS